jgi:thiol-disulfide isomerase/thioredoxin
MMVLFLFLAAASRGQEKEITMIRFSEFEEYLYRSSDSVYVINFWATWCGPCRRELPEFEKIHQDYVLKKVKVLLVSLDFPNQLDRGLKAYLENNRITAHVVLLNEPDANTWIDKVSPEWTGSLPATLVYKGSKRLFFEKELHYQDIESSIQSLINL